MKLLFPMAMIILAIICFMVAEAVIVNDTIDGETRKPSIPHDFRADSPREFISKSQMEQSMQLLEKKIKDRITCSKAGDHKGSIIFDTFDLVLTTCNLGNSGSSAWISVRITDDQQRTCEVLQFNAHTSLWTGTTHSFSNLHCISGNIGSPKSIEFKGGSNDAYCIAKVMVIPLGSQTIFKIEDSSVWIYSNWKKLPAEFGSQRKIMKRNAPMQTQRMFDGPGCNVQSGNVCCLSRQVEDMKTKFSTLNKNVQNLEKRIGIAFAVVGKRIPRLAKMRTNLEPLKATTNEHARVDIAVIDWEPDPRVVGADANANAEANPILTSEGKIAVQTEGLYYLYSTFFYLAGGIQCTYSLEWGDAPTDRLNTGRREYNIIKCSVLMDIGVDILQARKWRKCSLGFLVRLVRGAEIGLYHKQDSTTSCLTEETSFKEALARSYFGLFKVD